MIRVHLICVGKLKEAYLQLASAEYQKRLSAFCKLQIVELTEYKLPSSPSDAQIERAVEEEGKSILAALDRQEGVCFPLCIEGKMRSSEELAEELSTLAVSGTSTVSFVIGGSYGLAASVKARGKNLSMSSMTFPHQLARIMLLEQVYRAFQIQQNGKYHK